MSEETESTTKRNSGIYIKWVNECRDAWFKEWDYKPDFTEMTAIITAQFKGQFIVPKNNNKITTNNNK